VAFRTRYSGWILAVSMIFNWYSSGIFKVFKVFLLDSGGILGIHAGDFQVAFRRYRINMDSAGIYGILKVFNWFSI